MTNADMRGQLLEIADQYEQFADSIERVRFGGG